LIAIDLVAIYCCFFTWARAGSIQISALGLIVLKVVNVRSVDIITPDMFEKLEFINEARWF
jgi:hypothetical protein